MIIAEADDKTGARPSPYSPVPPGYYTASPYAPSSSNAHSSIPTRRSPSDSLRPPNPNAWPSSASETALPLHPPFPPLSRAASAAHPLPVVPAQPPSLSRPPPANLPRTPFAPMFLFATNNSLTKGFPYVLPPSTSTPHPFATNDILEQDWTQFLDDMRNVARLTPQDLTSAHCVPILSSVPIINLAVAGAIKHHIRRKKPRLVSLLVDKWNHHFFHPRRMEVILMRGQTKMSGQSDQPVANLYTPRTVNFTPPPLDGSVSSISRSPASELSENSPYSSQTGDPKDGDARQHAAHTHNRDRDKTWRLFVVSMEA